MPEGWKGDGKRHGLTKKQIKTSNGFVEREPGMRNKELSFALRGPVKRLIDIGVEEKKGTKKFTDKGIVELRDKKYDELKEKSRSLMNQIAQEIAELRPMGRQNELAAAMGIQPKKGVVVSTPFGEYVFAKARQPSKEQLESWFKRSKESDMLDNEAGKYTFDIGGKPDTWSGNYNTVKDAEILEEKGLLTSKEINLLSVLREFWEDHPGMDKQKGGGYWTNDGTLLTQKEFRKMRSKKKEEGKKRLEERKESKKEVPKPTLRFDYGSAYPTPDTMTKDDMVKQMVVFKYLRAKNSFTDENKEMELDIRDEAIKRGYDIDNMVKEDIKWHHHYRLPKGEIPKIQIVIDSIDSFSDFEKRILVGDVTPDELKEAYRSVMTNKDKIMAEISKTYKVADLKKRLTFARGNKSDLVKQFFDNKVRNRFTLYKTVSYMMFEETYESAEQKVVDGITEDDIQEFVKKVEGQKKERKEWTEKVKKAIEDPQDKEDFEIFIRYKGKDALTPEQSTRYDKVMGIDTKARRERDNEWKEERKVITKTKAVEGTEMSIHKTVHTKKGIDIWVAKMSTRVDKETFSSLRSRAKDYGGYYSRYSGGFIFSTEEDAKKFVNPKESVSAKEKIEQREEIKQKKVSNKFFDMANRIKERANENLSRDRLVNTARRARMAASSEADSMHEIYIAETMENLGMALEDGNLEFLNGLNSKTQIGMFDSILSTLKWRNDEKKGIRYEESKKRSLTKEDINSAEYPVPHVNIMSLKDIAKKIEGKPGTKRLIQKINEWVLYSKRKGIYNLDLYNEKDREIVEKVAKLGKKYGADNYDISTVKDGMADYNRLQRMGIKNVYEYRSALREFFKYRATAKKADPVKKLEREIIGMKIPGYFPTPNKVVKDMVKRANIQPGMEVLEPSAGKGNIADVLKEKGFIADVIEPISSLRNILEAKSHNVIAHDFMRFDNKKYDRIVMNPPFEKNQDIKHVLKAYERLKPGGRIVAIMSEHSFFAQDRESRDFQDFLAKVGSSEKLPQGSFKSTDRPTGVNARLVVIDKK